MATQIQNISSTPANIVGDLSLSSGSTYLIQAIDPADRHLEADRRNRRDLGVDGG